MAGRSRPSPDSSPTTFYTSKEESEDTNKSTTASTPTHGQSNLYRQARELPTELKAHCQIFLEEQLYLGAINLLNSILSAGASKRKPSGKPVPIPPASHLALLNTIAIHPLHTTRAEKPEHLDVSSLALGYLRNVLAMVGPLNADFRTAFQFLAIPRSGRRGGYNDFESDSDMLDDDLDSESNPLRGKMANESSVWAKGQDFWSTVGWAFNCCTSMPHRWRYWRAWLEFMLDVLDADWEERERFDEEAHAANGNKGKVPETLRSESMIVMYMDQQGGRQSGPKGILRALFAYSGSVSSAGFQEIFEKEHKGPRQPSKKRKREPVLDLANDKFGDYFDDESFSSGVSEPPTPQKKRTRKDAGSLSPGMVESIALRLRLFRLLSVATYTLRKKADLDRLYEDFASGIKVLPLEMFSLFVSQRPNPLLLETHVTLTKELFHLLLPSTIKDPRRVDPEGNSTGSLTPLMLEHCYVCYPANTVGLEDNAKLSLLVENAIQLLWICDTLQYTGSFAKAVEKGIEARNKKVEKKRTARGRTDAADTHALPVMNSSAERIRVLMDVLKPSSEGD
ncbi:hypothetical protein PT974_08468 [Cladobotryum mycophilum]|uniref:Uncharacterized protein n=1 Tax=Cladobotryum mycophilum TaxID=491253 RepID=A0ABR0SDF5_9HYPO